MPIQRCTKNGKRGFKWGASGTCYTGPGGRARALRQSRAIIASQRARGQQVKSSSKNSVEESVRVAQNKYGTWIIHEADRADWATLVNGTTTTVNLEPPVTITTDRASYSKHILQETPTRFKFDEELQIVWGEVYLPKLLDTQKDFMSAEEIRKMAHKFMASGKMKQIDVSHENEKTGSVVVESFIVREKDPDFPIPDAWVVGVHIPDHDLWEQVKSGELNAFSMQLTAQAEKKHVMVEVPEFLKGDTIATNGHKHVFTVRFDDEGNFVGGSTDMVAGHAHEISRVAATNKSGNPSHSHRFNFLELMFDGAKNR